MTTTPRPRIGRTLVVLDTPDLLPTARFYAELLGVEIAQTDDDWITLHAAGNGPRLAFQLAEQFSPPTWPSAEIGQQYHLDLYVDDLDAAEPFVLELGARPVEGPDDSPGFRVYLDPVGHPFCLCVD